MSWPWRVYEWGGVGLWRQQPVVTGRESKTIPADGTREWPSTPDVDMINRSHVTRIFRSAGDWGVSRVLTWGKECRKLSQTLVSAYRSCETLNHLYAFPPPEAFSFISAAQKNHIRSSHFSLFSFFMAFVLNWYVGCGLTSLLVLSCKRFNLLVWLVYVGFR